MKLTSPTMPDTDRYSTFWSTLAEVPYEVRWVQTGTYKTRVLIADQSDKPWLFLLHGTGGHLEAYLRNMGSHARSFRVVAYDLVGHGYSDGPDLAYEIPDYVEQLRLLMGALGAERAHLSGESLGGWIAARFALTHPEKVNRLVLNTTGGYTANRQVMQTIYDVTMAAVSNPTEEAVRARLEWLMADTNKVTDELVTVRRAIYSRAGYAETMRKVLVLQDPEVRVRNLLTPEDLKNILAQTLVLWTDHDPTAGVRVGKEIADTIPGAQFIVMKGCGHWPQFESASEFDDLHIRFLIGAD